MRKRKLTANQEDVLFDLELMAERGYGSRFLDGKRWATPLDLGGASGSHHSNTLKRLTEIGLVEQVNSGLGSRRPAYAYLITDAGREAIKDK